MVDNPYQLRRDWMASVCRCKQLPDSAKIVAYLLAEHWNTKTQEAYPSLATLAHGVARSVRTVQRALDELCGRGFLIKSPPRRGRSSNTYHLNFCLDEADPSNTLKSARRPRKAIEPASKRKRQLALQSWMNARAMDLGGFETGHVLLQQISEAEIESVYWRSVNGDWDPQKSVSELRELISALGDQDEGCSG